MTEKEMNEIKNRYLVKQILKPEEKLTVVFNCKGIDEKKKEHAGYPVRFVAVCEDGLIRPVILRSDGFEVVDPAEEDVSGIYNARQMNDMKLRCTHLFIDFD